MLFRKDDFERFIPHRQLLFVTIAAQILLALTSGAVISWSVAVGINEFRNFTSVIVGSCSLSLSLLATFAFFISTNSARKQIFKVANQNIAPFGGVALVVAIVAVLPGAIIAAITTEIVFGNDSLDVCPVDADCAPVNGVGFIIMRVAFFAGIGSQLCIWILAVYWLYCFLAVRRLSRRTNVTNEETPLIPNAPQTDSQIKEPPASPAKMSEEWRSEVRKELEKQKIKDSDVKKPKSPSPVLIVSLPEDDATPIVEEANEVLSKSLPKPDKKEKREKKRQKKLEKQSQTGTSLPDRSSKKSLWSKIKRTTSLRKSLASPQKKEAEALSRSNGESWDVETLEATAARFNALFKNPNPV
eukprot:TRINITY_DN2364_c0_g1_i1.p1 TRINITY_DN2364_c0_g1~~TRINITY_DN2364_c0_g1_i1.p1  ORF type:complete len:357 (-),score=44.99 TRINITY_DN2364_c0_g1_i1:10-1080(-)